MVDLVAGMSGLVAELGLGYNCSTRAVQVTEVGRHECYVEAENIVWNPGLGVDTGL